jgi:hypothetical protein
MTAISLLSAAPMTCEALTPAPRHAPLHACSGRLIFADTVAGHAIARLPGSSLARLNSCTGGRL